MSNPEKRDEQSMSDILASIRKLVAQEPALAMPPSPTRPALNGVSRATLDLPHEPELKLPPYKSEPEEGAAIPPAQAAEPISLDELLAEAPRAVPPAAPAAKPPAPASTTPPSGPAQQSAGAPEWLFPRPSVSETSKGVPTGQPVPASPQAKDARAAPATKVSAEAQPPSPAAKSEPSESSMPAKEAAPAAGTIGPPAPKLADLGSVVPGHRDNAGPPPILEGGPSRSGTSESPVLGPPLAGPLLGEPTRAPAAAAPMQEVPGADALRRLIAGVIPPSAHPSVATTKASEAAPAPATARTGSAPTADAGPKPAPEAEEAKAAPAAQPAAAKMPDVVAPQPPSASAPKSAVAAAAPAPAPAPKPKAMAPAPTAKAEAPAPAPATRSTTGMAGKTIDETVIELLRPLLRDWLDANMPRLIEPALKAELEALRNAAAKDKKD
jgi:nicotinate-nucleotide--dimethylbenzimidazole phosphoribosyltransferase